MKFIERFTAFIHSGLSLFILLFILNIDLADAQNLIPNSSFEETIQCPTWIANLDTDCKNWKSFRGSPDYFNSCAPYPSGFNNARGYQEAHTGFGYSGFATDNTIIGNVQEQLWIKLFTSLEKDCSYHLTFYLASGYNYRFNLASNNIGVLFTTYFYQQSISDPVNNQASFRFDSLIIDTLNWIEVNFSFTADSAYQYLVIGAFFDSSQTDTLTLPFPYDPQLTYRTSFYYVDDVTLLKENICQNVSFINMPNVFTPNADGVNDTFKPLEYFGIIDPHLQIFDRWGKVVFQTTILEESWDGMESSPGTYYWTMRYENLNGETKYENGYIALIK